VRSGLQWIGYIPRYLPRERAKSGERPINDWTRSRRRCPDGGPDANLRLCNFLNEQDQEASPLDDWREHSRRPTAANRAPPVNTRVTNNEVTCHPGAAGAMWTTIVITHTPSSENGYEVYINCARLLWRINELLCTLSCSISSCDQRYCKVHDALKSPLIPLEASHPL